MDKDLKEQNTGSPEQEVQERNQGAQEGLPETSEKEFIQVEKVRWIELEEKSKLIDSYVDLLQKLQAEYENYRKRVAKEKEEYRKFAVIDVFGEMLKILDNLHRAIESAKQNHSLDSLLEGIVLVEKQFSELLRRYNVLPIEVKEGDDFDPSLHDAISVEPIKDLPEGKILKVLQKGYKLNNRVIRPAVVVVSGKVEENESTEKES